LKKSYQIFHFLIALDLFISIIAIGNKVGFESISATSINHIIAVISNSRYDVNYYPLKIGEILTWANHDNMDHKIKISKNTTGESVSESNTIKAIFKLLIHL
jgi:hypothetical protein